MAYIDDIAKKIESFCPTSYACSWDNVGLIVGNRQKQVKKVLVSLDFDIGVAKEAKEAGAELIVTHHPVMFDPINKITADTPLGCALLYMIENGIALYSAHTNLDCAPGGINDYLVNLYGFTNSRHHSIEEGKEFGLARISEPHSPCTLKELAAHIAKKLGLSSISYVGNDDAIIKTALTCSGSGGSLITAANAELVDVFITGDVKYSSARDAAELGTNVICAGHYDTEIFVMDIFEKLLADADVEIIKSAANTNVFKSI